MLSFVLCQQGLKTTAVLRQKQLSVLMNSEPCTLALVYMHTHSHRSMCAGQEHVYTQTWQERKIRNLSSVYQAKRTDCSKPGTTNQKVCYTSEENTRNVSIPFSTVIVKRVFIQNWQLQQEIGDDFRLYYIMISLGHIRIHGIYHSIFPRKLFINAMTKQQH